MTPLITRVWKNDALVLDAPDGVELFAAGARLGVDLFSPAEGYVVEMSSCSEMTSYDFVEAEKLRREGLGAWFCQANEKRASVWK